MADMEMKMTVEEIKNAMLNPELIKHLHEFKASNQWGEVEGSFYILNKLF